MTEMNRVTISVPDWIDEAIVALRKDDRFVRCSYTEIVRQVIAIGLEAERNAKQSEKS